MSVEGFAGPETKKENAVNLSGLAFGFSDDDFLRKYYDSKLEELVDRDKWLEANRGRLAEKSQEIEKAVADGLIADSRPETIRQFQLEKTRKSSERVLAVREELSRRAEEMKAKVAEKLGNVLPPWVLEKARVNFTINENADFSVDGDQITVDLGRLAGEENYFETAVNGITHEIFHVWTGEKSSWSDEKLKTASPAELRQAIMFKTMDEGLAVLVAGQNLEDFHRGKGRNYRKYTEESFKAFKNFLKPDKNKEALVKIKKEEFEDMGHFYVVGNEMARRLAGAMSWDQFRTLVGEARENPRSFFEAYQRLGEKNKDWPKISI